jgi:peptidoglycan/LPS O-acetylase OafA/YrhL
MAPHRTNDMGADPTGRKHLPALDGVRGLAVLLVVAYHTGGGAQSPNAVLSVFGLALKAGWSGVTLFFLLSGFLITGILWDSKGAPHWWRNFYVRRLLRISPLYYSSLLLVVLVAWLHHFLGPGTRSLWVYAFYLQNIPGVIDKGAGLRPLQLSHFWSLAVEEQFYLIWPLLLRRLRTTAQVKYLCLGVFVASALFRYAIWTFDPQPLAFGGFLFSRAGELALGGYLAMSFRDGTWAGLERVAVYLTPIALLGFLVLCAAVRFELNTTTSATAGLALVTLFYAGVIALALRPGLLNRAMRAAWLRWIGGISYGIYVFHVLLEPLFGQLTLAIAPHAGRIEEIVLRASITWVLTLLIAWLSFRFFESPILSLRRYFQSRPQTRKEPNSPASA